MSLSCIFVAFLMPGGSVPQHIALADALEGIGCLVEIRETCASACTVLAGVARACIRPEAELIFHGPSNNGAPLAPDRFDHWSRAMAAHYPAPLGDWFMAEARFGEMSLSGAWLIEAGIMRACE